MHLIEVELYNQGMSNTYRVVQKLLWIKAPLLLKILFLTCYVHDMKEKIIVTMRKPNNKTTLLYLYRKNQLSNPFHCEVIDFMIMIQV